MTTVDATSILQATPCAAFIRARGAGYSFDYRFEDDGTVLEVFASLGEDLAGGASFRVSGDDGEHVFHCFNVEVDPPHQRRGLATTMYVLAERVSGRRLVNAQEGVDQTEDGSALWHQPARPFGDP